MLIWSIRFRKNVDSFVVSLRCSFWTFFSSDCCFCFKNKIKIKQLLTNLYFVAVREKGKGRSLVSALNGLAHMKLYLVCSINILQCQFGCMTFTMHHKLCFIHIWIIQAVKVGPTNWFFQWKRHNSLFGYYSFCLYLEFIS